MAAVRATVAAVRATVAAVRATVEVCLCLFSPRFIPTRILVAQGGAPSFLGQSTYMFSLKTIQQTRMC